MSTISLTVIEGRIALPDPHPLGNLPTAFGNDWVLLPPGVSWRRELKALYRALLHTICMSDEAFLALCKWMPSGANPDGSAASSGRSADRKVRRAVTAVYPAATATQPETAASGTGAAAAFPFASAPVFAAPARRTPQQWAALTGGVCAVGAGALLAWLACDHPAPRQPAFDAQSLRASSAGREATSPQRHAGGEVATGASGSAAGTAGTDAAGTNTVDAGTAGAVAARRNTARAVPAGEVAAAAAHGGTANASTANAVTTGAGAASNRPANAAPGEERVASMKHAGPAPTRRSTKGRERVEAAGAPAPTLAMHAPHASTLEVAKDKLRDMPRRHVARNAAGYASTEHRRLALGEMHARAVPRSAQRSRPAPSAAGEFSPFAPARLGIDEYADVTPSSATRLRGLGAQGASPAGKSSHSQADHGADWMNHIGQRRVTEIPDQFAK